MTNSSMRTVKSLVKEFLPPIVVRLLKSFTSSSRKEKKNDKEAKSNERAKGAKGCEQPPEFYDRMFLENNQWRKHYTESGYYPLWTVIADRIMRSKVNSILEIGCGSGQMALFLRDKGLSRYLGFDFSPERLNYAKKTCPEFDFVLADAFETDLFESCDYDAVLCTEFLEHVERDLEALSKIPSGKYFYGTVPNFTDRAHVRFFQSPEQVTARYARYFDSFNVVVHFANTKGKKFYLFEGIKR